MANDVVDCEAFKHSPVELLSAANFAVLAGSTVTNVGPSRVGGNLGVSPGTAVTGFPPGKVAVGSAIHAADGSSAQATLDLGSAMLATALLTECSVIKIGNLGGMTLYPGLYVSSSSMEITSGDLTLDAQGDESAVFIFKMASTFITTSGRQIFLAGGAQQKNIFWLVGSSATLGGTSVFHGTLMADQSITVGGGASVTGRVLAKVAAVGLNANAIVLPPVWSNTRQLTANLVATECGTFKQSPVDLLSAATYAVLAGSTVTNTGPTTVKGNLGVSPGTAVTGFPPGKVAVGSAIHAADGSSAQATLDLGSAMLATALLTECSVIKIGNLGGMTLYPGLYVSSSSMEITSGDLTLDAQGDESAVFIFKMATTFITTSGRQIFLAGGAQQKNIFWLVGTSATLGGTSVFHGTLMADQSITVGGGASVTGRVLAKVAAVGLNANVLVLPAV